MRAIARLTGASLLFDPAAVQGLKAAPVTGKLSAEEAVTKVLEGTGLMLTVQKGGVLVVRPGVGPAPVGAPAPAASSPSSAPAATSSRASNGLGKQVALAVPASTTDAGPSSAADSPAGTVASQKVEITGSRLRRIDTEAALPVNIYSRDDIDRSGQPTLERFLASLSETSVSQGEGSFAASTQGQGTVQLRGLPLGSTLVLINGRRVEAVGSSSANFFNLNLIPLAAVERVEIVPVGSSAVYGGDALAGVVNVILRKSIDGGTFTARLASGKGFGDGSAALGVGDSGDKGSWMVLGSFSKATPLTTGERDFFRDSDYRRFGGPDARVRNCTPGTVTSSSGANLPGLTSPFAGIPGSSGPLTIQSFAATAGQPNLCSIAGNVNGTALIHGSETASVHATGERRLGETTYLFGELTRAQERVEVRDLGINFNNVLVPASNAYNPFGVPVRVTARLGRDNGSEGYSRDTDFTRVLGGVRGEISARWDYEATVSRSMDSGERLLFNNAINTAARTAALASSDPALALNPFTSGQAASESVLRGIWSDAVRENKGRKDIAAAFARGPVLTLPAGPLDAIIGAEAARDSYDTLITGSHYVNTRRAGAFYGELRLPLFRGVEGERSWSMAALTLAGRRDHYSDFGSASTYQAGLEVRPIQTLLLRASVATSFKPPTLLQTSVDDLTFPIEVTGVTDPLRGNQLVTGGEWVRTTNRALHPEEGRAYALGAIWEPAGSGLRLGATAWRVRIDGLIGLLSSQVIVNNETLFPGWVIRAPSAGGVPGPITRLLSAESNFGFVETQGVDLEANRSWRSEWGRWSLGASATRTSAYNVAIVPGAPVDNRLGKHFTEYWAPKWKGRLSAGLDQGTWSLGISSRYLGGYEDDGLSRRRLGDTWLHDLSGRLNLARLGVSLGPAKAATLSLVIVNITNKLPTFASASPYFDTSQADWRGRYASVRLSADW